MDRPPAELALQPLLVPDQLVGQGITGCRIGRLEDALAVAVPEGLVDRVLLAQATGRLIRTSNDRGVVAVMDPRLGKANYRWDIVKALPPMKRTRSRADAEAFLREITAN